MKVGSSSGRTNQSQGPESNINCHRFILPPLLATPTMQFSLDHKRRSHKQNHCPASNTVGLLFTRSYRSTLLTPTTTLSPVKTSLKWGDSQGNPSRVVLYCSYLEVSEIPRGSLNNQSMHALLSTTKTRTLTRVVKLSAGGLGITSKHSDRKNVLRRFLRIPSLTCGLR